MSWNEFDNLELKNKEHYLQKFKEAVNKAKINKISEGEKIIKEIIKNYLIFTIVPKELKTQFQSLRKQYPNEFLGYTILANKEKNIRVSCFGVDYSSLGESLII